MPTKVLTPTQSLRVGFRKELKVTFHGVLFNLHVDFIDLPDENILVRSNGCHLNILYISYIIYVYIYIYLFIAKPFAKK